MYSYVSLWKCVPVGAVADDGQKRALVPGGWELNLYPPQEQHGLLTTELFLFPFPQVTLGQATLEFFIFLPQPPECWDYKGVTPWLGEIVLAIVDRDL